jgi:flagellar biosynthesis/type III secretory pathway protein FliH
MLIEKEEKMRQLIKVTDEHYENGFQTGWLDASLGQNYSIPVNNAYPEGWGKGYKDGQVAYEASIDRKKRDYFKNKALFFRGITDTIVVG